MKLSEGFDNSFEDNETDYSEIFSEHDTNEVEKMKRFYVYGIDKSLDIDDLTIDISTVFKNNTYTTNATYIDLPLGCMYKKPKIFERGELENKISEWKSKELTDEQIENRVMMLKGVYYKYDHFPVQIVLNSNPERTYITVNSFYSGDRDDAEDRNQIDTYCPIKNLAGLPEKVGTLKIKSLSKKTPLLSLQGMPKELKKFEMGMVYGLPTLKELYNTKFTNLNTAEIPEDSDGFHINTGTVETKYREEDSPGTASYEDRYKKGDAYEVVSRTTNNLSIELYYKFVRTYKNFSNFYKDLLQSVNTSYLKPTEYIQIRYDIKTKELGQGYCHMYNVGGTSVLCTNGVEDKPRKNQAWNDPEFKGKLVHSEVKRRWPEDDYQTGSYSGYLNCYIIEDGKLKEIRPNFLKGKIYDKPSYMDADFLEESFNDSKIISDHTSVNKLYMPWKLNENFENSFDDAEDDYTEVMDKSDLDAKYFSIKQFAFEASKISDSKYFKCFSTASELSRIYDPGVDNGRIDINLDEVLPEGKDELKNYCLYIWRGPQIHIANPMEINLIFNAFIYKEDDGWEGEKGIYENIVSTFTDRGIHDDKRYVEINGVPNNMKGGNANELLTNYEENIFKPALEKGIYDSITNIISKG